jgi:myo-inositol-1(or 4)-monophosphatase
MVRPGGCGHKPGRAVREAAVHRGYDRAVPRTDLSRELGVAITAARAAGAIQVERYERLERIVHKSEKDVVTEADHLSEEAILATIREAFPDDRSLAEESGASGTGKVDASGRVWVVDPLDGTVNYANGIPVFCVAVGLAERGRPVVGVVYDPVRDEMFTAVTGRGARLDGAPIRHPVKEKLSDCVVSLALPRRGWAGRETRVRRAIRVSRSMGSAALAPTYLANGRFDGFVQSGGLSLWDICAAGLIAPEGGARLTTLDGRPWFDIGRASKSIGLVGAAPAHHQTVLELLR